MNYQIYLLEAVETVLSWDISEEVFAQTVSNQVRLIAGINPEETLGLYSENHTHR